MLALNAGLLALGCLILLHRSVVLRLALTKQYGLGAYRIGILVCALVGLTLVVSGKSNAEYVAVWLPPASLKLAVLPLMFLGFAVAAAELVPSNLRRWLGRPIACGALIWFLTHLLVKGDSASMVLFGGLALLAVLEIVRSPRRDPPWAGNKLPWMKESLTIAVGGSAFLLLFALHYPLFGALPTMMGGAFF